MITLEKFNPHDVQPLGSVSNRETSSLTEPQFFDPNHVSFTGEYTGLPKVPNPPPKKPVPRTASY